MGMWHEDKSRNSQMGGEQDDEETWGLEGGYSSDRGHSKHSLDWQVVSLGKICQLRVKKKMKEKGMTLTGRMKGVHHCLR
jgi:hypothetical protein